MKIAVEGCAHGELEKIYDVIAYFEKKNDTKVDLLLCCGDFQATRNVHDLNSMAVPPKYREMCTFYKLVIFLLKASFVLCLLVFKNVRLRTSVRRYRSNSVK